MATDSDGRVAGKVALVTGAASNPGLGHAIAHTLAREGAKLIVTDIDEPGVKKTAREITEAGGTALAFRHDVTDESDWLRVIKAATDEFGGIDILVNNAGIALLQLLEDTTEEIWTRQLDVNLNGSFHGCKLGLTEMKRRGGGSIINMSSIAGHVGSRTTFAYAASKGGVLAMSRSLAVEGAPDNVRCNTIHPGMIWTNMQAGATGLTSVDDIKVPASAVPMGRPGTAQEVANVALFLASDEASYVTGAEFVVDGGMTAQ